MVNTWLFDDFCDLISDQRTKAPVSPSWLMKKLPRGSPILWIGTLIIHEIGNLFNQAVKELNRHPPYLGLREHRVPHSIHWLMIMWLVLYCHINVYIYNINTCWSLTLTYHMYITSHVHLLVDDHIAYSQYSTSLGSCNILPYNLQWT